MFTIPAGFGPRLSAELAAREKSLDLFTNLRPPVAPESGMTVALRGLARLAPPAPDGLAQAFAEFAKSPEYKAHLEAIERNRLRFPGGLSLGLDHAFPLLPIGRGSREEGDEDGPVILELLDRPGGASRA